jgi:hypothetical protein
VLGVIHIVSILVDIGEFKETIFKDSVRAILSSYKLCEDKLFPDRYRGMEYNFRMHIITKHRYQTSHSTLLQITQQANRLMPF